ncbi:YpmS family protein [uncultured Enterococcus sp.]|uniref:YpmS family protein n=1 Tax=uncultured Enterococcus sp. TaxID=167972 RepID=UPI0025E1E1C9|nr:YpmS family protein [uncultured Enterococcus sp.]
MEPKTDKQIPHQNKRQHNYWKIAFLVLVGLILGTGVFITSRILDTKPFPVKETPAIVERNGTPVVNISSNKTQVNELIDFYLGDYREKSGLDYEFVLNDQAMLKGEFKLLGVPINFYLYFDPYVMEDGNVQLKAKSLSIGTLGVPISEVMKLIKRSYELPEWIEIDAKEKTVMIRLDQFRMQNGLFIKAEKIDLVDDVIQASLYLPASTKE